MRFEFVNDDKEIKRSELCVDYGKMLNLPRGKKFGALLFVQIFAENEIFLQAITFAKSTK